MINITIDKGGNSNSDNALNQWHSCMMDILDRGVNNGGDGGDTSPLHRFLSGGTPMCDVPPRIWLKIAPIVKYFLQIFGDFVKPTGVFNAHWQFKLVVHTVR